MESGEIEMRVQFKDARPNYNYQWGYIITNEDPAILRQLMTRSKWRRRNVRRVLGIASAGEIPLQTLIQHADEVVAVDHAPPSLVWALIKSLMIEQLSNHDVRNFFLGPLDDVDKRIKELYALLPLSLRTSVPNVYQGVSPFFGGVVIREDYRERLLSKWRWVSDNILDRAREKLDNITFIKGDIRDFPDAAFDLVYASNCMAHTDTAHDRKGPLINEILQAIKSKGGLIYTVSRHNPVTHPDHKAFKLLKTVAGPVTDPTWRGDTYDYYLISKESA